MESDAVNTQNISGIDTGKAIFEFQGHFNGKPVTWQCTLQTLDHYYEELLRNKKIESNIPVTLKRFINIIGTDSPTPSINITLDVEIIDEPTIRKTIIMVHNYKKLQEGLHEYGEAYTYPRK